MERKAVSMLMRRASLATIVCLVCVLFSSVTPLRAQVDTGTILGTVSDASGAAIHGASVTLVNEGTNATLTTSTGSDGGYKFTPVSIGSYKISASYQGFQTTAERHVTVNVGSSV